MNKLISAIVLTYNEEINLSKCLTSLKKINADIILVDSYSTDNTLSIGESFGARIYQNKWVNYSNQFNWAINNTNINTKWILRIDADEWLDDKLITDINLKISNLSEDITSIYLNRLAIFEGKPLKYTRFSSKKHLKIWRTGLGFCQNTWMDEHIIVENGNSITFNGRLVDENKKNIVEFISKHNTYAIRESMHYFMLKHKKYHVSNFGNKNESSRVVLLRKIYYSYIPKTLRPIFLFIFEYIICFGFLDGIKGFYYCFFQTLFYRSLVEHITSSANDYSKGDYNKIDEYFFENYGYKINKL